MSLQEMKCDNCGNSYDKSFQVIQQGVVHTFDSFECAINVMAPQCNHCGTRVIGHGIEDKGTIYCCAHCASHQSSEVFRDRAN